MLIGEDDDRVVIEDEVSMIVVEEEVNVDTDSAIFAGNTTGRRY